MANDYQELNILIEVLIEDYHKLHLDEFQTITRQFEISIDYNKHLSPELKEIEKLFIHLMFLMKDHMEKEENELFPLIQLLVSMGEGESFSAMSSLPSIALTIEKTELEHEEIHQSMERLVELTNGYKAPVNAEENCRILYRQLKEMDTRLRRHAYLEDSFLHPKAIALQESLVNSY